MEPLRFHFKMLQQIKAQNQPYFQSAKQSFYIQINDIDGVAQFKRHILYKMGNFIKRLLAKSPETVSKSEIILDAEPQPDEKPEETIFQIRQKPKEETPFQKPVLKELSIALVQLLEMEPEIIKFINEDNWILEKKFIPLLQHFNVLKYVEACSVRSITIQLTCSQASDIVRLKDMKCNEDYQKDEGSEFTEKVAIGVIYADLFKINFVQLRKLKIIGANKESNEAIFSMEMLQYVKMPNIEELHVDNTNLTSLNFLKKCHWKKLRILSVRNSRIYDNHRFASVLPYISNSQHVETLNLCPQKDAITEISWLLKMGVPDAQVQKNRLDIEVDYYYECEGRTLRRVQFGIDGMRNRRPHIEMIRRKYNHRYFDNPLVLW